MDFSAFNSELSEVWVLTLTGQGSLCRFNISIELACMTRRCHMVPDQPNWATSLAVERQSQESQA